MTQLRAAAVAAFFLGVGLAGEPFVPFRALIAAIVLALVAISLERSRSSLIVFALAFFGVLLTCYLQHGEVYPGGGVVAFGLGALAAATHGRRTAPTAVATIGTVVGAGLFFLL